ncbi:DUF1707 SHOCT-like domain-containing protein [Pseudonocardia sp. GCM10023141]|uniref:DUF1707 SHOCT-like domain-containing protein n=1 Tax=Pseudonocardia sp. GCM10023141 TaxID=3252653 RepID=UPI00361F7665
MTIHESHLRVSDTEREAVATTLRDAATEGRLTLEETDERQATAYAARTREDLMVLTADLPRPEPAAAPVRRGRGELTAAARRRLAVHAAVVAVIAVAMLARWALGPTAPGPAPWFWPAVPLFWLTISVVVHHRRAAREPAPALATT